MAMGPEEGPSVGPAIGSVGPAIGPDLGPSVGPSVGPTVGPPVGPSVEPTVDPQAGPGVGPSPAEPSAAPLEEKKKKHEGLKTGADFEKPKKMHKVMGRLKHEELDWIWIGSADDARDAALLKKHNVKYILNCTPPRNEKGVLNFHERDKNFTYCRISVGDNATENLRPHFEKACEFLDMVRIREDGDVLVHCQQGVSRSCSFTLCYLMKYYQIPFEEGVSMAREVRAQANPNEGFSKQLKDYWHELESTKGFEKRPPPRLKRSAADAGLPQAGGLPGKRAAGPARGPVGPPRGPAGPAPGPARGPVGLARGPVGPSVGPAPGPTKGPLGPAKGPVKGPIGPARP